MCSIPKKTKKELDEKEIEGFKIEFKTLKELNSPYIIKVYSYLEEENSYIMEYLDYNLENYLKKYPDLSLEYRKLMGIQLIKGVKYIPFK
ncbi:protein kinase [Spiroplasma endosymbiont of Diplazon laetatorius]|uniref:protein kinase n=1 Tax=Spiroplasma endosymbiont of Diplazon laetatorius TaxID=3066322 RepID=UPI0030D11DF1